MLELFLFLLVGVGLTNIVVNASILDSLREFLSASDFLNALLGCMLCTGFWIGIVLWLFNPTLFIQFGFLAPFCAGAAVSLSSNLYDVLTDYLIIRQE